MSDSEYPEIGEIYRYFEGGLCQVITLASDDRDDQEKVVYQNLGGDYRCHIIRLEDFMAEVDRREYPTSRQRHAYERVDRDSLSDEKEQPPAGPKTREEKRADLLGDFLDARSNEEKLKILRSMKEDFLNDHTLRVISQSLDFTENKTDLDERYYDIQKYLNLLIRYEGGNRSR